MGLFFVFVFFFFEKCLLDEGPFCGATGTLCFGFRITLPMSFTVRVDRLSPVFFCGLHSMISRVISGCWDQTSNLDCSPRREHDTSMPARPGSHRSDVHAVLSQIQESLPKVQTISLKLGTSCDGCNGTLE